MKSHAHLFFVLILLFLSRSLFAQQAMQDAVYLRDGSIIRGTILQSIADSTTRIEIEGGSVFVVRTSEIMKTELEPAPGKTNRRELNIPSRGYYNITEVGVLPGTTYDYYGYNQQRNNGGTLQNVNGYRFNRFLMAGAAIGVDFVQHALFQLNADVRFEPLRRRAAPFLFAQSGYSWTLDKSPDYSGQTNRFTGGPAYSAGIGMHYYFRGEGSFLFSMGYKQDRYTELVSYDLSQSNTLQKYTLNRLVIKAGLGF